MSGVRVPPPLPKLSNDFIQISFNALRGNRARMALGFILGFRCVRLNATGHHKLTAAADRETPNTAYAKKTVGSDLTVWDLLDNTAGDGLIHKAVAVEHGMHGRLGRDAHITGELAHQQLLPGRPRRPGNRGFAMGARGAVPADAPIGDSCVLRDRGRRGFFLFFASAAVSSR